MKEMQIINKYIMEIQVKVNTIARKGRRNNGKGKEKEQTRKRGEKTTKAIGNRMWILYLYCTLPTLCLFHFHFIVMFIVILYLYFSVIILSFHCYSHCQFIYPFVISIFIANLYSTRIIILFSIPVIVFTFILLLFYLISIELMF